MASLSCSFVTFSNKGCDISKRFPGVTEYFPLTSCHKDIKAHLRAVNVSQTSVLTEKDLILARSGHFEEEGLNMTVCPKHRAELGIFWRPGRKCTHPLHGDRNGRPERGANLQMCKEAMKKWSVLIPVGAGICKRCRIDHLEALRMEQSAEDLRTEQYEPPDQARSNILPSFSVHTPDPFLSPAPLVADDVESPLELSLPTNLGSDLPLVTGGAQPGQPGDDCSDAFSSGSQESLTAVETSLEWQPTPQVQLKLHALNNFLRHADGSLSPVRSQLSTNADNVSSCTARYYKRKGVQVLETVFEAIAPGQSKWLTQQVIEKYCHSTNPEVNTPEQTLLSRLIILYNEASSWYTRQQILSVFVCDYSKTELLNYLPGLSKWRIDEARKHANLNSPGQVIDLPVLQRCRLHPVKVDHFLDFISSPSFLQDVAYGTKNLKLSDGHTIEIPNVVRTVVASRLIRLYQEHCRESGFEPIGRSTLFNILKICAASQKKSLSGLDSTQTDGVDGFTSLEEATNTLSTLGLHEQTARDITSRLQVAKTYLKTDYKIHVSRADPCADHCSVYALSSDEPEYQGYCEHEHNMICDRCENYRNALADLQLSLSSSAVKYSGNDQQEEIRYKIDTAFPKIDEWKAHILRAAHQDGAKSDIIDNLLTSQVLLIMDWAMKFLPASFRETQRDWFGKKGKSWHVTVAVTKSDDEEIEARTYIHLFEECTQNWFAVASIIEHTLTTLNAEKPNIQEAFLRSDNAGCYHCAYLILSLPSIGERAGIMIKRYDFSDPQAGKDVCDRRTAALKAHMRRYINEGHDITSAGDMKTAIDSYGGVKGCHAAVVKIQESNQTMKKHTMTGIQALNNFSFESAGLRAWRAYNVGPGKLFTPTQVKRFGLPQGPTGLQVVQPFSVPREDVGVFRSLSTRVECVHPQPCTPQSVKDSPADVATRAFFSCPEEGCTKTYQSFTNLQKHLDTGKHLVKLERESTYDSVKKKWAEMCKEVSGSYIHRETASNPQTSRYDPTCQISSGWALKTSRKATRFTEKVKTHLKQIFMEGEETGRKASAFDVCSKMRALRDDSGRKIFSKEEWLTTEQIARYFSRLSVLYRSGRLAIEQADQDEEEDFVGEAEEMRTRLEIRRQLEL